MAKGSIYREKNVQLKKQLERENKLRKENASRMHQALRVKNSLVILGLSRVASGVQNLAVLSVEEFELAQVDVDRWGPYLAHLYAKEERSLTIQNIRNKLLSLRPDCQSGYTKTWEGGVTHYVGARDLLNTTHFVRGDSFGVAKHRHIR